MAIFVLNAIVGLPYERFDAAIRSHVNLVCGDDAQKVLSVDDAHITPMIDNLNHYHNLDVEKMSDTMFNICRAIDGEMDQPDDDMQETPQIAERETLQIEDAPRTFAERETNLARTIANDHLRTMETPRATLAEIRDAVTARTIPRTMGIGTENVARTVETIPRFNDVQMCGSVSLFAPLVVLEGNEAKTAIAAKLGDATSSSARILSDKIETLNRMMSQLAALSREINTLQAPIENHPVIAKIITGVEGLRADPMVDSAFISNNSVVIRTKEIVTVPCPVDGVPRRIGCMEFEISLSALVGIHSDVARPVIIRNLTRELIVHASPTNVLEGFQCPHVSLIGLPCMDRLSNQLVSAMSITDLQTIFVLLVRFVKNPNNSDTWGRNWQMWPKFIPTTEGATR